jgi:hypothetical protein
MSAANSAPATSATKDTKIETKKAAIIPPAAPASVPSSRSSDLIFAVIVAAVLLLTFFVILSTGSIIAVGVLWVVIAMVLFLLNAYGFLTTDIVTSVTTKPPKNNQPVGSAASSLPSGEVVGSEVFHLSDNKFTYNDASAVCAAYGAELATLEQVINAYNHGAEWCNYGWTAGGMALYPTQKASWDILQGEIDQSKRTACGRPGVNGGYFDPTSKFGVNCYGFKPPGNIPLPRPLPGTDTNAFNSSVERWKSMIKSLNIDSFSRTVWSASPTNAIVNAGKTLTEHFIGDVVREHATFADSSFMEVLPGRTITDTAGAVDAPYGLIPSCPDKPAPGSGTTPATGSGTTPAASSSSNGVASAAVTTAEETERKIKAEAERAAAAENEKKLKAAADAAAAKTAADAKAAASKAAADKAEADRIAAEKAVADAKAAEQAAAEKAEAEASAAADRAAAEAAAAAIIAAKAAADAAAAKAAADAKARADAAAAAKAAADKAAKAEAARVVNIGTGLAKKPQGCRSGDTNTGLLCTEPINTKCEPLTWDGCCSRGLFNECYGCARGGQCKTTGGGTYAQELKCESGKDDIDGLCYNPCPAGKRHIAGAPWNCKA